ncbi:conserved exported hypothetical protein [Flavobacterium psychrophilum]|uniref:hypothetical protein n=1 Tax=Flavobacterium psychrophilum TaxID=96345 RepID=UPI000B7C2EA0|nr:hypothetical protein [Flavobacterium psychrophilum]SNB43716.1 conserved exported hypothetical protein [Flavobacterium psychrophilum]
MNKFHISVIIVFGFLLMPNNIFACGSKSDKNSCNKEISGSKPKEKSCHKDSTTKKDSKKSCCDSNNSEEKDNNCGGKCGHSNCTSSSSVNFSIISFYEIEFKNNNFDFSSEKSKFYHSETFISSGFYSLWLIPKIS